MDASIKGIRPGPLEKGVQARLAALGGRISAPDAHRMARWLGWSSIGLGALELGAPRAVAVLTGAGRTLPGRLVLRACGARELLGGAGILARADASPWLWGRVAADLVDLGLLGTAVITRRRGGRVRLVVSATTVAGVMLLDAMVAARLSAVAGRMGVDGSLHARAAVTIGRPVEDVYELWRHVEDLPRALHHVRAVHAREEGRSHWVVRGPFGRNVEWDAEVTEVLSNRSIGWRSAQGAPVEHRGVVSFRPAPGGRGSELAVELWYAPPGGVAGAAVAAAFGEGAREQLRDDLARFKQFVETGDVARSEASPQGAVIHQLFRQRPARPAA